MLTQQNLPNAQWLEALSLRQSTHPKMVTAPAPCDEDLAQILQAAMSAPDHKALRPYRFLVIEGDDRYAFGQLLGEGYRELKPDASEEKIQKKVAKALRSPMIIVVYAHLVEHKKVPEVEQLITTGCAALQMLHAASALGYGAALLTGNNVYTRAVHDGLGLEANEKIVGLFYVGTPARTDTPIKPRPDHRAFTKRWPNKG